MLISFGAYFAKYNNLERIIFIIDIFLVSSLCFSIGLLLSSVVNEYMTDELDRTKEKNIIFGEIAAECLFTIFLVYFIFFGISLIPSIAKNPPIEHKNFRLIGAEFLLTFVIIACQLKMSDKIRFLFNEYEDLEEEKTELLNKQLKECNNNFAGFTCK